MWPYKWLMYVLCGTELDTANAVDNNCMNWNKDREVGTVGGCFPSLQSTGTVTWSDRKDLCMFHTTNTHWWRRMKMRKPHAIPSVPYICCQVGISDLCSQRWRVAFALNSELYLIHVLQSVQKNIFIHSMHNTQVCEFTHNLQFNLLYSF